MRNEKGFILPLTLIILFLLTNYTIYQIRQYVIEKEILFEQSEALSAERLLQVGIVDIEKFIETKQQLFECSGILYYDEGEVSYTVKKDSEKTYHIILLSKTKNNRTRQINYTYPSGCSSKCEE